MSSLVQGTEHCLATDGTLLVIDLYALVVDVYLFELALGAKIGLHPEVFRLLYR